MSDEFAALDEAIDRAHGRTPAARVPSASGSGRSHRGVDPDRLTGFAAEQYATHLRMHRTFGMDEAAASRAAIEDLIEVRVVERSALDEHVDALRAGDSFFNGRPYRSWDEDARQLASEMYGTSSLDEARRCGALRRQVEEPGRLRRDRYGGR